MPTLTDAHVPIIGQQLVVEGYTIAASARCQCKSGGSLVPLTVTASAAGTVAPVGHCPSCGMGYGVEGVQMDAKGRLTFAVAVLSAKPSADS